jgi:hypothetical protein
MALEPQFADVNTFGAIVKENMESRSSACICFRFRHYMKVQRRGHEPTMSCIVKGNVTRGRLLLRLE